MAQQKSRNPFRRNKARHRYAAHQIAIPGVAESTKQLVTKTESWQEKVLKYASIVPEVMSGYSFVNNTMDRVTLEIERFDRAENQWLRATSPEITGIERRLNQTFRMGRAAALTHLVEEAYILVERVQGPNGTVFGFETLSPKEIQNKSGDLEKRILKGGKESWEKILDNTTVIRVYTPDPIDRFLAGGPHKSLLGLLETMAIELLRDQSDAISVLAGNGILLIPTEVIPDEMDTVDASETPGTRANFESRLEDAMLSTIVDRSRGEAVVPIALYGPAEYLSEVRHVLPTRADSAADTKSRMDGYIERYARDIDLPPQVILGLGDANHWSDWKVDENTWAYHLEPRAQRIADAVFDGLIGPILHNLGEEQSQYRLRPNASQAIAKQDVSRSAEAAYRLGAIEPESYVEAIGMDASDLRSDAEENLLILTGSVDDAALAGSGVDQSIPDRVAAARRVTPQAILRQASRIANQQQGRLHRTYATILRRVAEDAARDGRLAKKGRDEASKTAAAADIAFEGYDPEAYFQRYAAELQTATNNELFAYLRRIATLTGSDYQSLRMVWAGEFEARSAQVATQAEQIARNVTERSFASGKTARVPDNVIRALTSTANGGSNSTNGEAGNTNRPTHAGEDPMIQDVLKESVPERFVTQYTWIVGDPTHPFEPHQELEGRTWYSWEEYDSLNVGSEDPQTIGDVYFPGDHNGCQCDYDIEFVPASEAS